MAKTIKMAIYGEPGVGKSTFAFSAPNPLFITTDGNYEYLIDYFNADPANCKQVFTWSEARHVLNTVDYNKYDTIVIDLLEDLYMWAEQEFCKDNNLKHISDFGYGKGYGMVGNDFFIEFQKLLALPKNIILILHGSATTQKDRRGVEYTKYAPVSYLREKLRDQIEGRVRFFVRAFATTEEDRDGKLVTNRYLSLSPDGQTEYGITRGLTGDVPRYIPLDWNVFYAIATRNDKLNDKPEAPRLVGPAKPVEEVKPLKETKVVKQAALKQPAAVAPTPTPAGSVAEPVVAPTITPENKLDSIKAKLAAVKAADAQVQPEPKPAVVEPAPVKPTEVVVETTGDLLVQAVAEIKKDLSNEDKLAAIKAKMAALKGK